MAVPEMKISDLRSHLAEVVREADMLDQATVITQNGRPAAVVVGFDEVSIHEVGHRRDIY